MNSRREFARPPMGGQNHSSTIPPEMHVCMKVNIVSDGPGGISFSQSVNTPGTYNGFYDSPNPSGLLDQNSYALPIPESSMLPWPQSMADKNDQPAEPLVQMPTDTSQENVPDTQPPLATDKNGDKKKHKHRHKHHRKKDEQSVTRSQSATSLATSTKISQSDLLVVDIQKKHRTKKASDENSSTTRSRSSTHASRYQKKETRHTVMAPAASGTANSSDPLEIIAGSKLDELLSEVIINTFSDENPKSDTANDRGKSANRSFEHLKFENSNGPKDDGRIRARFLSPTRLQSTYPIPVQTPTIPKITASQASQADEPYQASRGIQTEFEPEKVKKKKKSKPPSEVSEIAPVQDYLKHIAQATAGLIEASKAVLEQRSQTPLLVEQEIHQPRVSKETLIDDPAIPPFDQSISADNSLEKRGRRTPVAVDHHLNRSNGSIGADRSFDRLPAHNHANQHQHQYAQEQQPTGEPGVYYVHTYCAICGSPRASRKAISGSRSPIDQSGKNDHFLSQTRPGGGGDEIQQIPPIIIEQIQEIASDRDHDHYHEHVQYNKPNQGRKSPVIYEVPSDAIRVDIGHRNIENLVHIEEMSEVNFREEERIRILEMDEITAQARARLRELNLLSDDAEPRIQIGRPLRMFSPDTSEITKSTDTSYEHPVHSPIIDQPKIPDGNLVIDPPILDLKEALEQRRIHLAKERERFLGPQLMENPELTDFYDRNAVYVPLASENPSFFTDRENAGFLEVNGQSDYDRSIDNQSINQPYTDYVTQTRLSSAKIFEIHMKPKSESVQLFTKMNKSSSSSSESGSISRKAMIGSGARSIDDLSADDSQSSRPEMSSFRTDQKLQYDTLSSTTSGASSQRKPNDLYRKVLLNQGQQSKKDNFSSLGGSSINSERSSVSNILRERGAGAFTTSEIDRYLEDNVSDYIQDRLTPLEDDWTALAASDTGTRSHDSLASETSLKADASHDFYDPKSDHSSGNRPINAIPEKSFADIMRERCLQRNTRYFSMYAHQQPTLDRIEEQDAENASRPRTNSTVTVESEKTITDSIDREGSGVYEIRPSKLRIHKSSLDDAGSSSWIGSELENADEYSQGRISPMMDIGNDHATISSYGELTKDTVRTAQIRNQDPAELLTINESYGLAKERVITKSPNTMITGQNSRSMITDHRSSNVITQENSSNFEQKRYRQTDL